MADPDEQVVDERREKAVRVRKKLRAVAGVVAAIDHFDFVGAYTLPQNLEKLRKLIDEKKSDWEGMEVRALPVPDLRAGPGYR